MFIFSLSMATQDAKCSPLGFFEHLPPEVREEIWSFYFAMAVSTIKVLPIGRDGHGNDRYYLQPYDRDLLLVSRAIRHEALPYHCPPKLANNGPALGSSGLKRVDWEIPERLQEKTTTIIAHIDPIRPPDYLPNLKVYGTYKHGQRLELRLNVSEHEVVRWARSNQLPEPVAAPAWDEVYANIVRVFKDWVWTCPWSYAFGPEPPVVYLREDPIFRSPCGRNEISAEIECWRSSTANNNESKMILKALVRSSSLAID